MRSDSQCLVPATQPIRFQWLQCEAPPDADYGVCSVGCTCKKCSVSRYNKIRRCATVNKSKYFQHRSITASEHRTVAYHPCTPDLGAILGSARNRALYSKGHCKGRKEYSQDEERDAS
ncbi:uncharacterized protein LOC113565947 [Drosophila persimilis]|uniref:uncharacterized protein LOC113565832 n=1 Tax=Drosophila persimilis TaxID=7234 RepID=UPI000F094E4F|nr:uncharacterized protein LOC113565832 [Drosophila persimilis]XP_026845157.1 uncharacterized protein LOC113565947 [Drosophila persimilis]